MKPPSDLLSSRDIGEGVPLAALQRDQCRWAVNDARYGEQHLFCAEAVEPGRSYCPHHNERAAARVVLDEVA